MPCDLEDTQARTDHILSRLEAVRSWAAPKFKGKPGSLAEAEFRRALRTAHDNLVHGTSKIREEIEKACTGDIPDDRILLRLGAAETLEQTALLAQLYAIEVAFEKTRAAVEAETRHRGREFRHAVAKFERIPHGAEWTPSPYRQLLLKKLPVPKTAAEATRKLLAMAAKDLEDASKECPPGWDEALPTTWVTDMALFITLGNNSRFLILKLLDGTSSPSNIASSKDAPNPVRFLAKELADAAPPDSPASSSLEATLQSYAEAVREALRDGMFASETAINRAAPEWLRSLCELLINPADFGSGVRSILDKVAADPTNAQDWASEESNLASCVKVAVRVLVEAGK